MVWGYERGNAPRRRPAWRRTRSAHRRARQAHAGAAPRNWGKRWPICCAGRSTHTATAPSSRKDQVRRKLCGERDVHLRLARRGRGRRRVARRAHRHRTRARRCAAAGGDDRLPHRIPIHVGADPRRGARRGHTHRLDPGCHRTGLPRSGHLHPGDEHRLSPTTDGADPRARGRAIGVGGSVAVPTDHRQSEPLGGSRPAAAAHFGTLRRGGSGAARDRKAGIAHDRKQALHP